MNTQRRILLVENDARIGGSGRSLMSLVEGIDRRRFLLFVACPGNGPVSEWIRRQGLECQWPPAYLGRGISIGSQGSWAAWFGILARRHGIGLVHVNEVTGFRLAGWGARMVGIPSICHVRMAPTAEELTWSFALAKPSALIFNSRAMAAHTRSLLSASCNEIPAVIVPNGVDTERFRPAKSVEDAKRQLGWPPDVPAVTVVSNLSPLKGQDILIDAAALLCGMHRSPVEFHLVGRDLTDDGRIVRALQRQIQRLGLANRIHLQDVTEDVVTVFQASDVVAWPSRSVSVGPSGEDRPVRSIGFPRCAIEAGACGRPVVLADTPGAAEAAIPGETALLVPPEDPRALASAIHELLRAPVRREAMGRSGRALVMSRFDLKRHIRLVERAYASVLDSTRVAANPAPDSWVTTAGRG